MPKDNRAVVQGVNVAKKHTKPRGMGQPGGIVEVEATIHLSNLKLVDPQDRQADPGRVPRVGRRPQGSCGQGHRQRDRELRRRSWPTRRRLAAKGGAKAGGKAGAKGGGGAAGARQHRRQGRGAAARFVTRRGQLHGGSRSRPRHRSGETPAHAAALPRRGPRRAADGVRLHEPDAGAQAREDRHQHGRGRSRRRPEEARRGGGRTGADQRPEAGEDGGEEGDRRASRSARACRSAAR